MIAKPAVVLSIRGVWLWAHADVRRGGTTDRANVPRTQKQLAPHARVGIRALHHIVDHTRRAGPAKLVGLGEAPNPVAPAVVVEAVSAVCDRTVGLHTNQRGRLDVRVPAAVTHVKERHLRDERGRCVRRVQGLAHEPHPKLGPEGGD